MTMQTIYTNVLNSEVQRLGNSLSWNFKIEAGDLILMHRSGYTIRKVVELNKFYGIVAAGKNTEVFEQKLPANPVRRFLWLHGFKGKDICSVRELLDLQQSEADRVHAINPESCDIPPLRFWDARNCSVAVMIYRNTGGRNFWKIGINPDATPEDIRHVVRAEFICNKWYGVHNAKYRFAADRSEMTEDDMF